ncbi:hypothetical protein MKW94_020030, partial [Papaver nudicaule]|nr:hypothetical protein [Papaver nudicaule]
MVDTRSNSSPKRSTPSPTSSNNAGTSGDSSSPPSKRSKINEAPEEEASSIDEVDSGSGSLPAVAKALDDQKQVPLQECETTQKRSTDHVAQDDKGKVLRLLPLSKQSAKTAPNKASLKVPWGKLVSQNPDFIIRESPFSVGQSPDCSLCLEDPSVSQVLCTLRRVTQVEKKGSNSVLLEVSGVKGTVQVNGKIYCKDTSVELQEGDLLDFGSSGRHAYIFQRLPSARDKIASVSLGIGNILMSFHQFKPNIRVLDGQSVSVALTSAAQRKALKDSLQQGILCSDDIKVSFDGFPYYLSENTRNVLIATAHMHFKCSNLLKYAVGLPTVSPRILLSGPAGSEVYQENLTKALAKHFGARLLIVDSLLLPGDILPQGSKPSKERSMSYALPSKKSAVDFLGAPALGFHNPGKQESSVKLSKIYKIGDRVKYVGPPPSRLPYLPPRGPAFGYRGVVLVPPAHESGSYEVGVRFDRIIQEGDVLGGLCEADHGFFCSADLLCLDNSRSDDLDKLVINELFEIVCSESKSAGLILFLKEIEKSLSAHSEAYTTLKHKLGNLPDNVIVIGSHTQMDNIMQKSHSDSSIFSSKLSDLAFPNNVVGPYCSIEEITETSMQLSRLFPNKVTIELPQDEALLLDLKEQLDHDVETLTANSNIASIRSVLRRSRLECPDLEKICIKNQTHTSESVEKIIAWALAHSLMNNSKASASGDKFVVSYESINYGLSLLESTQNESKRTKKSLKDVVTENNFEKKLLADVIPPADIGITFDDIGALETVKDTLKELVMLPLQRPELFSKGQLTK